MRHGSEERAFQDALASTPNDATTKGVYADWLDEHGANEQAARLRTWAKLERHLEEQGPDRIWSEVPRVHPWVQQLILVHQLRKGIGEHRWHGSTWQDTLLPALASVERHALGVGHPDDAREHENRVRAFSDQTEAYDRANGYGTEDGEPQPWATLTMATHHLTQSTQFPGERSHTDNARNWAEQHTQAYHTAAKDHLYYGAGDGPTKLAAIETDNRGTVNVRVPVPEPVETAPQQTQPAKAPTAPRGPVLFLPQ